MPKKYARKKSPTYSTVWASGNSEPTYNGAYVFEKMENGKPRYIHTIEPTLYLYIVADTDGYFSLYAYIGGLGEYLQYFSFENVATPDLVVEWYVNEGAPSPAPLITNYEIPS